MPFDAFKTSAIMMEDTAESDRFLDDGSQLESLTLNKVNLEEREQEIDHIVRSIQELNDVFKDLAVMISDQVGSLRIFWGFLLIIFLVLREPCLIGSIII